MQCIGELRAALHDHGQVLIRTVPRRGYRFEADVSVLTDPLPQIQAPDVGRASLSPENSVIGGIHAEPRPGTLRVSRSSSKVVALAAAFALLIGVLALGLESAKAPVRIDEEMASRSTVAVMPFTAVTNDVEARTLGDLFTDAVAAQFAARKGMRGLGRTVTAAYAGAPLDKIASKLKASLLVTGQVARMAGDRVAVDVQLVSAIDGGVIWSRHWDVALDPPGAGGARA